MHWYDHDQLIFDSPSFGQLLYTSNAVDDGASSWSNSFGYGAVQRRRYMQNTVARGQQ